MNELILKFEIFINSLRDNESRNSLFDFIWKKYYRKLKYYIVRNFNFHPQDIDEMIQEIMIRIYNNLEKYDLIHSFNTWFYTIARNYCIDAIKRKGFDMTTEESELPDDKNEGYQFLEKKELNGIIERALSSLNRIDSEILYLRYYESMKINEISGIINVPGGTVKSRLFYLKKKLRDELKEEL